MSPPSTTDSEAALRPPPPPPLSSRTARPPRRPKRSSTAALFARPPPASVLLVAASIASAFTLGTLLGSRLWSADLTAGRGGRGGGIARFGGGTDGGGERHAPAAPPPPPATPPPTPPPPRAHDMSLDQIVLVGDSITQFAWDVDNYGFAAIIAQEYVRRMDVVNRGYSGFTTEYVRHFLRETLQSTLPPPSSPHLADPPHTALVAVFLGANDASLAPAVGIPLRRFAENLKQIVLDVRDALPRARVVVVATPPVDENRAADRSVARARAFRDAAAVVVEEITREDAIRRRGAAAVAAAEAAADSLEGHGGGSGDDDGGSGGGWRWLHFLDTWTVFFGPNATWSQERCDAVLADGLHFAREGNWLMARAVMDLVRDAWPEIAPEAVPPRVPWQIDVDGLPESAFVNARR
ncbi:SGNH hydrolase-type esterase domain-containing protein [Zopfochytrium polystomum]|nr:SGNH hydrolase-type esterase domain-containing protein [Zopfochytrium polystomum]